jgi:hypothetical protein
MAREMTDYRLPDGRIVPIHADVARGNILVSFTLADGRIVDAVRVASMTPYEHTRKAIEALLWAIEDLRPHTPAVRHLQQLADVLAAQFHADFEGEAHENRS